METHEDIMRISAQARAAASKSESCIWAEGTEYTAESLESMYEDYVVEELEDDHDDYWDFASWCEQELGIPNKT